MTEKPCKQCHKVKSLGCFYRHPSYADGHEGICKPCKRANVAENVELKRDYYRERKREIAARPYYVEQRRAYARSERGRAVHRAACRRYYRLKEVFA